MNVQVQQGVPPECHAKLRDLHRLLSRLLQHHEQLIEVIQGKLLAMRQSDIPAVYDSIRSEHGLVQAIADDENLRRGLMQHIAEDLGLAAEGARRMTVKDLARHLSAEDSISLQAVARQLAHIMDEIAKVNRVIHRFAQQMLTHYRHIFADITRSLQEPGVYASSGTVTSEVRAKVVDQTG